MGKIILCMDNGNSYFEETKKYLGSHKCKVYSISEKEQNIKAFMEDIDQREGKLDILLLGVDERIPQDVAVGETHDCEMPLKSLGGQINRVQEVIDTALPLLRKGDEKCIGMITKKESSISNCKDDRN